MRADPYSPAVLARVLLRYVPMPLIYEALGLVLAQGESGRKYLAKLVPDALNDPSRAVGALTTDLVANGRHLEFASTLLRLAPNDVVLQGILGGQVAVDASGTPIDSTLQTIRNSVEPFLQSGEFVDFLATVRHKVCAIHVNDPRMGPGVKGSGFLIGPDLVLTAWHVVEGLLATRPAVGGERAFGPLHLVPEPAPGSEAKLRCIFDYWVPVSHWDFTRPPSSVVIAGAVPNWLEWWSVKHNDDGRRHVFDDPPDIRDCFDCAILRIDRPVGTQATTYGGGRIRGWVPLDELGDLPQQGEIVAVLQHPAGGPQQWDKGAHAGTAPGNTRVWYKTESSGGSSGSPCFLSNTRLIGFHNAGFPSDKSDGIATNECNQGVALHGALPSLPVALRRPPIPATSALWSVSDDRQHPHPLLGRAALLKAVEALSSPNSERRVIVVEDRLGSRGRTGKTFSVEVLRAMVRDRRGMVLPLNAKDLLVAEPDRLLHTLAVQLSLPVGEVVMPSRPADERQVARWWSSDLPNWFGDLLIRQAGDNGALMASPPLSAASMSSRDPLLGEPTLREPIWIAIDDLHRQPLEGGIRECVAGLIGATELTTAHPGLSALRWLLVGHVPDFLRERATPYLPEELSVEAIGMNDYTECARVAFLSMGAFGAFSRDTAEVLFEFALTREPDLQPDRAEVYLERLAKLSLDALRVLFARSGLEL